MLLEGGLRPRCGACGNLTRFDVVFARRTAAFFHFNVAGDLTVEEERVLAEEVESVECRWCGHGRDVEFVDGVGLVGQGGDAAPGREDDEPRAL